MKLAAILLAVTPGLLSSCSGVPVTGVPVRVYSCAPPTWFEAARVVRENAAQPRFYPDGRVLAFTHGGWRLADLELCLDVARVNVDAIVRPTSEVLPIITGSHADLTPAWSPQGGEIALEADEGHGRRALWVVEASGRGARKLTDHESKTTGGVDWTPDGKSLVDSALTEGRMQLFTIPADGSQATRLGSDPANLLHPQVSPDGRWVATTQVTWSKEIWRMKLE